MKRPPEKLSPYYARPLLAVKRPSNDSYLCTPRFAGIRARGRGARRTPPQVGAPGGQKAQKSYLPNMCTETQTPHTLGVRVRCLLGGI